MQQSWVSLTPKCCFTILILNRWSVPLFPLKVYFLPTILLFLLQNFRITWSKSESNYSLVCMKLKGLMRVSRFNFVNKLLYIFMMLDSTHSWLECWAIFSWDTEWAEVTPARSAHSWKTRNVWVECLCLLCGIIFTFTIQEFSRSLVKKASDLL